MGEAKGMMPTPSPAPAPTPQPHRRPRAREVSSRFMTPLLKPSPSSSSTAGDLHHPVPRSPLSKPVVSTSTEFLPRTQVRRSKSVQRQRNQQDSESDDENRPESHHNISSTDTVRAQSKAALMTKQRLTGRSRADTPMATMNSFDRTNSTTTRARRGNLLGMTAATAESAAMKLLQSNGMSGSQFGDVGSRSRGNSREPSPKSSPVKGQVGDAGSKSRGNSREPSPKSSPVKGHQFDAPSLPDTGGCDGSKVGSSPCCRSLNLEIHSTRPNDKSGNLLLRSCSNPSKSMMLSGSNGSGVCLPPMPPHAGSKMVVGLGGEGKKAMKGEDFHRLRLLNNRFLEWRYANAKAEAAMQAQQKQSEGMLYSLGVKLSELRESVKTKRIELELLQRTKTLSTILDAHMPYLDEWVALEQDYSTSVGDTIQGLSSVSSQIPIGGNVRCDVKGVEEALISAAKALESTEEQIRNFMPQAELVDNLISQVAVVYGGERDLVEECGSLLFKAHLSQVEECSLRASLMQFHKMKSLPA